MANPEHLEILKQGVEVWNKWREENHEIIPDLSKTILIEMYLAGANLEGVNFRISNLGGAQLSSSTLSGANFEGANLSGADLRGANLYNAGLSSAKLNYVHLSEAYLEGAELTKAMLHKTLFIDVDLSKAKGLDSCNHYGPSTIDHRTLEKSGPLPLEFLRGIGLPDNYIEYIPSLFHGDAIQYYSCFISYPSTNQDFAERLHADLQNKGVRCWFAPEDMKIGDKIRHAIDSAIRLRDKLLVILSETSVNSQWVETEVETAMEEERERGEPVLFPVRIDDAVMETKAPWARMLRRERNIGNFTGWKNHDSYQKAFERLLRDLKA